MNNYKKLKRINELIRDIECAQEARPTEDRGLMLEAFWLLRNKLEEETEPSDEPDIRIFPK